MLKPQTQYEKEFMDRMNLDQAINFFDHTVNEAEKIIKKIL